MSETQKKIAKDDKFNSSLFANHSNNYEYFNFLDSKLISKNDSQKLKGK